MEEKKTVEELIERLRLNREKVPAELLKTRYKQAYEQLLEDIKTGLMDRLKPIAFKLPEWVPKKLPEAYVNEIIDAANRIYKDGEYAKKIGRAVFKRYSFQEAEKLAEEINKTFAKELITIARSKDCLYATVACWLADNPQTPKIYNDFVGKFYDEANNRWRDPEPGEKEPAILIFIQKEE